MAKKKTTVKKKAAKAPAKKTTGGLLPEPTPLGTVHNRVDPVYQTAVALIELLPNISDGDVVSQRALAELYELQRLHTLLNKLFESKGLLSKLAPDFKARGVVGEDGDVLLTYKDTPGRSSVSWKNAAMHYGQVVTEKVDGVPFIADTFEAKAKGEFGSPAGAAKVKAVLSLK